MHEMRGFPPVGGNGVHRKNTVELDRVDTADPTPGGVGLSARADETTITTATTREGISLRTGNPLSLIRLSGWRAQRSRTLGPQPICARLGFVQHRCNPARPI